ncbi:MAG TPA: glycosyltransferase [Longimicrobiaceae bacterium]
MKLLYLINSLGAGGAERSLVELLPHYQSSGIDISLVCLEPRRVGVEADARLLGTDLVYLSGALPGWIASFRRLISRRHPDLIHTTLFDAHLVGRLGAMGTEVPVLSSLVSTPYVPSRKKDRNLNQTAFRLVKALDGWTARHLTSRFHAISHTVRDAYVASLGLPPERITVIERGRDPQRLGQPDETRRQRVRRALGIDPAIPLLINVGRHEYPKGQPVLLRAMAILRERHADAVLLIAGRDGHMTRELERLHQELRLGGRVRFLGHRTDVPDLLAASDLFVFPSLYEGLGGAVLEAMALELPIVASDIPAMREVVGSAGCGLLVEPEDPAALATAIERLITDAELRRILGVRGGHRFRERYAIDRCARRMVDLYGEVVEEHDARQRSWRRRKAATAGADTSPIRPA